MVQLPGCCVSWVRIGHPFPGFPENAKTYPLMTPSDKGLGVVSIFFFFFFYNNVGFSIEVSRIFFETMDGGFLTFGKSGKSVSNGCPIRADFGTFRKIRNDATTHDSGSLFRGRLLSKGDR